MRKKFIGVFIFGLIYFLFSQVVFGDTTATPCSYEVFSNDKIYIFVMLAPDEEIECISQGKEKKQEAKKLRKSFQSSGLYKNDNLQRPLWTVDWYSFQVFISSDGKCLIQNRSLGIKTD